MPLAAVESPSVHATRRLTASPALLKIAGGVVVLGIWEIVVRLWAPAYVAKPTGIATVVPSVLASTAVLSAAGITLAAVAQGLCIAVVSGTLVGLLVGSVRLAERALGIYVNGLYAMPMVAVVPLLPIWFGYTSAALIAPSSLLRSFPSP